MNYQIPCHDPRHPGYIDDIQNVTLLPCKHQDEMSTRNIEEIVNTLMASKGKRYFACPQCRKPVRILEGKNYKTILASCLPDGRPITQKIASQLRKRGHIVNSGPIGKIVRKKTAGESSSSCTIL